MASFRRMGCTFVETVGRSAVRRYATSQRDQTIPKFSPVEDSVAPQRMEKCVNQVMLLGRVGADPQLRGSENHPVTIFSLATNSNFKLESGDLQQKTEWHRIAVFNPNLRASTLKFVKKGQRLMVQGRLMYGEIKDVNGIKHTTASIVADEVVFLQGPSGKSNAEEQQ